MYVRIKYIPILYVYLGGDPIFRILVFIGAPTLYSNYGTKSPSTTVFWDLAWHNGSMTMAYGQHMMDRRVTDIIRRYLLRCLL